MPLFVPDVDESGLASPLTTKGDLWTFDTDQAREPVGADGTVLTANASQPTGHSWEVPETWSVFTLVGDNDEVGLSDANVLVIAAAHDNLIRLPDIARLSPSPPGRLALGIKNAIGGGPTTVVAHDVSQTIDGSTDPLVLSSPLEALYLRNDGVNTWHILARVSATVDATTITGIVTSDHLPADLAYTDVANIFTVAPQTVTDGAGNTVTIQTNEIDMVDDQGGVGHFLTSQMFLQGPTGAPGTIDLQAGNTCLLNMYEPTSGANFQIDVLSTAGLTFTDPTTFFFGVDNANGIRFNNGSTAFAINHGTITTMNGSAPGVGQVPIGNGTGLVMGALSSAELPVAVAYTNVGNTFTQLQQLPALAVTGLTGATAASRYVGATASGAPLTGAFLVGDFIIDRSGALWVCTTAGSPGTWVASAGALPADVAYTDVANTFTVSQEVDVGAADDALTVTAFGGAALTAVSVTGRGILANSTSGDAGYFVTASGHGIVGGSTTGVGVYGVSEQNTALHAEQDGSLIAATAQPAFSVLRNGITAATNVYSGPLIFGNDAPTGTGVSTGPLVQLQHNTSDAFVVDNLGKLTTVLGSTPSNGQLLIGDGTGFSLASLSAGANVTITPGAGSITIDGAGTTIQSVTVAGTTILVAPAIGDLLVKVNTSGVTLDLPLASTMVGRRVYVVADQPGYATTVHTAAGSLDALAQFGAQTSGGGTSFTQTEDAGGTGALSQVYLADNSGNWFVLETAPTALPADVAYTDVANSFSQTQTVNAPGSAYGVHVGSGTSTAAGFFQSGSGTYAVQATNLAGMGLFASSRDSIALQAKQTGTLTSPNSSHALSVVRDGVTAGGNVYNYPLIYGNDAPGGTADSTGYLLQLQHNYTDAFVVDNLGKLITIAGSTPSNGQLLIGDGAGFSLASLTAGTNITITPGAGSITIDAAAGGLPFVFRAATADTALDDVGSATAISMTDLGSNFAGNGTWLYWATVTVENTGTVPANVVLMVSYNGTGDTVSSTETTIVNGDVGTLTVSGSFTTTGNSYLTVYVRAFGTGSACSVKYLSPDNAEFHASTLTALKVVTT